MALGTFRPGHYAMTHDGDAVGLVTSGGQNLRWRPSKKKIQDTSIYGDTLIDGIYRGMTGVQLLVTFKEWNAAIREIIWPYNATLGVNGIVGQLDSDLAKAIVLTAQSGSPAATNGPTPFTASKAIISDLNDINILFGPDEHDIPVLFDLLLYDSSGTKIFFTMPQPA
jgi:hypothetical protein